ncbi:GPN-loop GTPase 3-like [Dioscorea cayenensis subsp. rotundata]|uniref:GPN-loop GTPase 3 n=1 Tax=Dioscorea cayennensis subsp. rotundata TaxID=55577 RepID=A0AB40CKM8_DIOCR|nr:GPN-loop GTPase 3-like [Dioscorea cayenensis subsp. rotundata]
MGYAQLFIGPTGSGKSTYSSSLYQHYDTIRRTMHVFNLDPAANFDNLVAMVLYDIPMFCAPIRELISLDDVMKELGLGPNGGLIYCMENLEVNLDDLLVEELDNYLDDDYLISCSIIIESIADRYPGVEQYAIRSFVDALYSIPLGLVENSDLQPIDTLAAVEMLNFSFIKCSFILYELVLVVMLIASHKATQLNQKPTYAEVFNRTHKGDKGRGDYVDNKSKSVSESYTSSISQKYGVDESSHPEFDPQAWNAGFSQIGMNNKDHEDETTDCQD